MKILKVKKKDGDSKKKILESLRKTNVELLYAGSLATRAMMANEDIGDIDYLEFARISKRIRELMEKLK